MRIRRSLIILLTGALIIGTAQIAYGNGRTPPRPEGASPIKAICSLRGGGQLEIFRVRLIGGDGSDEDLKVTIGGVTRELALSEIKKIEFLTTQINANGFMEAAVFRTDVVEKTSAMVQVISSRGSTVRLAGFESSGASVSIDLSTCQSVTLTHANEGMTDSTPTSDRTHRIKE